MFALSVRVKIPAVLNTLRHPVIREWLVILLLLSSVVLFSLRGEWFSRLDQTLYDQAISLWQRPAQHDIVIIGIDEESLRQFGRWPWRRNIHATLLEYLATAGAKVVALDVILSEADQRDAPSDMLLAQAIKHNQRVVLPITARTSDENLTGESQPIPEFSQAAARLGHITTQFDSDGVVRMVFLRAGMTYPRHDLLALAALAVAEPERWTNSVALPGESVPHNRARGILWAADHAYLIPYAGPPGHFEALPYFAVLRGDYPPTFFKDKIVLVGMTASGLGDEFPTPVSGLERAMSGIEIHANVLQALREGVDLRRMSLRLSATLSICILLCLMLAYLWLSPRQSIALTAMLGIAIILSTLLLFRYGAIWAPPVPLLFGLILAYPIWSWRKLEATQRYLNEELASLEREPSIVALETTQALLSLPPSPIIFVPDVVEQRIVALRTATQRLRNLNRFVVNSIESLPAAALVTDFNGKVMLANTSADRLFGAGVVLPTETSAQQQLLMKSQPSKLQRSKSQPLNGLDVFNLMADIHHHENRSWRELWAGVANDMSVITVEASGRDDHEYLVQIAPSFTNSGVHTATIVTLTDISPLRESERRRDEALRFLSHDMRSPQASILTLLEMQRDDPGSMTNEKLHDRIGRYARRTLTLADDFLRLAKAERSRPQDFDPLDLSELLLDATEDGWSLAMAKNIQVVSDVPMDEAWVSGDRDLLTRMLVNLLSNAIKYSPPHTTVSCRLHLESASWIMEITDQGYGIAAADISKLFTRFARIRQEGQPEEEGIGLGLAFVKTVVLRHNGSISVESKTAALGDAVESAAIATTEHVRRSGTTFTIRLPAIERPTD